MEPQRTSTERFARRRTVTRRFAAKPRDFSEYLESARDIERRIQKAEERNSRELPSVDLYNLSPCWRVETGGAMKPRSHSRSAALWDVATDLSLRLIKIFLKDESGRRPVYG